MDGNGLECTGLWPKVAESGGKGSNVVQRGRTCAAVPRR